MTFILNEKEEKRLPQRNRSAENEEYWSEQSGITKCPDCGNVRFRKKWFPSEEVLREKIEVSDIEIMHTRLCPACMMIQGHLFWGELFLEWFPKRLEEELLRLVQSYGQKALEKDPQNRIIAVEKTSEGHRVTTVKNQLANRLAKKIKDVFNTVELCMSYAPEPAKVDRVHAVFQAPEETS